MLGLALLMRLRSVGNSARICDPVSRRLQTDSLQSTVCLCLPVQLDQCKDSDASTADRRGGTNPFVTYTKACLKADSQRVN